jgi:uncharacterized membrane protein
MTFLHILKSLDELLYEVTLWLLFYPRTLWRSVRHPLRTMRYALDELSKDEDAQFLETLRPPIFLLLTVIIAHVVELAMVGDSKIIASHSGAADLIDDDRGLVIMRIVAFALFPVVMAAFEAWVARQPVNRDTLRAPFSAQCFLAAPFVLVLNFAGIVLRYPQWADIIALIAAAAASVAYVSAEALWLKRSTDAGWKRAVSGAVAGYLVCAVVLALMAWLLGGA